MNRLRIFARHTAFFFIALTAESAFADNSKISPDLLPLIANPANKVNVIVQYNAPLCSGGGLLGGLLCLPIDLLGGVLHTVFSLINAVTGTLTGSDVVSLSNQSNVSYISLDRTSSRRWTTAPRRWVLRSLELGLDGTGIGVAMIDSGIYSHPDLTAANSGSRVSSTGRVSSAVHSIDDFGHGTHVAGILAGNGKTLKRPRFHAYPAAAWLPMPIFSTCACLTSKRREQRQRRDRRDPGSRDVEEQIQRTGDQSFARPSDL